MPSIDVSETRGVRYLHFGSPWVQGAMRIARPFALELEYTRELMLPLVLRDDPAWPRSVFQAGLGAASITRFLYRHRPSARLVVAERVPQVVAAARQFFRLPEDPERVAVHVADATDLIAGKGAPFDFIVVDGFDERGRAGMLDTLAFYANCRARLSPRGLFAVNLLDGRRGVAPSVKRLRDAFEDRVLVLPPSEAGNTVAVAAAGHPVEMPLPALHQAVRLLKDGTGLDLKPTLARLEQALQGPDALRL